MPAAPPLLFRETAPTTPFFHVVRHEFQSSGGYRIHGHADFAELFWVESGRGHHLVNGAVQELQRGSLVLVRRRDVHGFFIDARDRMTLVNLAFPSAVIDDWGSRYFTGKELLFWSQSPLPEHLHCPAERLQKLRRLSERLSECPQTLFHLEWFLMNLIHLLLPGRTHESARAPLPPILAAALEKLREPSRFAQGPQELAKLAGCSLQHLNRQLQRHLGRSASAVVNQCRLDYATVQLQLTDRTILDICLDCGFQNLGHFYQLFKKRHQVTPRQFRLGRQRVIRA